MKYIYIISVYIFISFISVYPQTTIYSNFGSGNTYNTTTGLAVLSSQFAAANFTVGSPGYSDITLTVAIAGISNGNLNIAIYNDDGANLPTGSPLASGTVTLTLNTHAIKSINFPSLILNEGSYDVVMSPGTAATGGWNNNILGIKGASTSSSSGISWSYTAGQTTPVFKVEGNSALPVELSSFTASPNGNDVELQWSTSTEVNNYGFEVERLKDYKIERLKDFENETWEKIGFIKGNGNSNSVKTYSYVDEKPLAGKSYYRLKQVDNDGQFEYSKTVEASFMKPYKFVLEQNYPNPFNPSTTISYTIPKEGKVKLVIYNLLGQVVKTLIDETKEAGINTVKFSSEGLSSGVYLYTLESEGLVQSKKLTVLK